MFPEASSNDGKPTKIKNGEYIYVPNFYNQEIADKYFKRLIEEPIVFQFVSIPPSHLLFT